MRFVRTSYVEQLEAEYAQAQANLAEFQELQPFIEIAQDIRGRVIEELGSLSTSRSAEVEEMAFKQVYEEERETAVGELVAQYADEHREKLYKRVRAVVEEESGEEILATVAQKVETDPELALKLRDDARRELLKKAEEAVAAKLAKEQEALIKAEAARQIALDKLNVEVALDGQIDLSDPRLGKYLRPHDKLVVSFEEVDDKRCKQVFELQEDVQGRRGWVLGETVYPKDSGTGRTLYLVIGRTPSDRFVTIGCQAPDLVSGNREICDNRIRSRLPLAMSWLKGSFVISGKMRDRFGNSYDRPLVVESIDFQTRNIDFAE